MRSWGCGTSIIVDRDYRRRGDAKGRRCDDVNSSCSPCGGWRGANADRTTSTALSWEDALAQIRLVQEQYPELASEEYTEDFFAYFEELLGASELAGEGWDDEGSDGFGDYSDDEYQAGDMPPGAGFN